MELIQGVTKGITNALLVSTIPEDFFARGMTYTYQDYHTFGASEVKDFLFDPTGYTPPPGGQNRIVGFFPSVFAEAGPILVDFYHSTTASEDGTLLDIFNRDSTSSNTPSSTLRLGPTVSNAGTRFSGIGVPANATGAGQQVSSSVEESLPFALDITMKYLMRFTNQNGADTLVSIRFTFFEI